MRRPGKLRAFLVALLAGLFVQRPAMPVTGVDPRIDELEKRVRRAGAPDSLKYELARLRAAGERIEDRRRAMDLMNDIRPTYWDRTDYHWTRARLFESCQQPSMARGCLEQVTRLAPDDVEAWVEIARLRLRELLYEFDPSMSGPMLNALERALALEPDHRDALFLKSLDLELIANQPGHAIPELTAQGIACLGGILDRDSTDIPARLLLAVHLLDAHRAEEAAGQFQRALEAGPATVRDAFQTCRWTASSHAFRYAAALSDTNQRVFDEAYWSLQDPTPLSLLNENQLETWKRLALADILFGQPETGLAGWNTDPGEALVRFGKPTSRRFDPGEILSYLAVEQSLPHAGISGEGAASSRQAISLRPPSWRWNYRFRGLDFALDLSDVALNGTFTFDDPSRAVLTHLREAAPAIFGEAPPGEIRHIYLAAAGVRGEGRTVEQTVDVGIPLWRPDAGGKDLDQVQIQIVIRDSTEQIVRQTLSHMTAGELGSVRLDDRLDLLLWRSVYHILPGRYTITAFVDDEKHHQHGSLRQPMEVRDFSADSQLVVGDLELALGDEAATGPAAARAGETYVPDPLALTGKDRRLMVFFDLYGLRERDGLSTHQTRYTIVPREGVLEFERLVRAGQARPGQFISFAGRLAERGVELDEHNYSDVLFPPATMAVMNGRVTRGTKLLLPELEPGEYAFIVSVTDRLSQASAHRMTFFRVLTSRQRRDLAAGTRN